MLKIDVSQNLEVHLYTDLKIITYPLINICGISMKNIRLFIESLHYLKYLITFIL